MKPSRLVPLLLIAAVLVYLIVGLPKGFSTDLTRIGTAPVTVVGVHDINLVASTEMMDLLDRLHDGYGDEVLFLVSDSNNRPGRRFTAEHGVRAATLLIFDALGQKVTTLLSPLDEAVVRGEINRELKASKSTP